jgi:flagellar FliL protein
MAEEDGATEEAAEEKSGGMMKMIVLGGVAVVLLVVGIFAGPAIMNMISPPPAEESEAQEAPGSGPAIYTSLHPPLVVNFKDSAGDQHFMQITMEVMARDQDVINAVREHTPVIRNNLILLYGTADYDEVTTREGKEKMLDDGLQSIREVMLERIGEEGVEAVYFTSLIIQ